NTADRHLAGARRRAVEVHGATSALRNPAAVARASQPDRVAQHPEQRGVGFDVDLVGFAVDGKRDHPRPLELAGQVGSESQIRSPWSRYLVAISPRTPNFAAVGLAGIARSEIILGLAACAGPVCAAAAACGPSALRIEKENTTHEWRFRRPLLAGHRLAGRSGNLLPLPAPDLCRPGSGACRHRPLRTRLPGRLQA